jgi:predicted ATP-grasp superfamily ATP-dependent carboligase
MRRIEGYQHRQTRTRQRALWLGGVPAEPVRVTHQDERIYPVIADHARANWSGSGRRAESKEDLSLYEMSRATILVGFAEALSAPEVVWSLVDAGFQVVAFARKGRRSALRFSRHVVCHEIHAPESDLEAALADLHSLLNSVRPETAGTPLVLFPLDDKAVWLCSRAEIDDRWLFAGPLGACSELALNKNLQVEAARAAGFNVPKSRLVRNAKDLLEFGTAETFPIILKAADAVPTYQGRVHSCRKWICATRAELERAIDEWKERVPLLAQTFITGVGEGVFGLAAPDGIRAWSGHRRVRMMNPQGSGSSACVSQSIPDELRSHAEAFLTKAGWRGLFMIELLRDDSGKLWFVELNGRTWGSMALCRRQGLEYPAWQVELTMDERSPAGSAGHSPMTIVCRHAGREFMHLLFVLKGARSSALRQWPSFWKTVADIARIHPGDGLYNWRRDDPKVFLADFYYTVHDNVFKSRN